MCNLYSVQRSAPEIAAHFGVSDPALLDIPPETKPGEPGIIVRKTGGGRVMQSLRWGFPRPQADRDGSALHLKPVLGWMELRASSSRVAVTVMPSDGSVSGDCGCVWVNAARAERSADPATTADTPMRHRIASPCASVEFSKVPRDHDPI
jgi:hypothetical protein